jgi:hypothetical protein
MYIQNVKAKAIIRVTGRGSLQGCETSKLTYVAEKEFTDGGKVVRLVRRPRLPSGRFLVLISVKG